MLRNEDYLQTCRNSGDGPCSDLYKDFGDIHATDFKTWWSANGARLFGEHERTSIVIYKDGVFDPSVNAGRNALLLNVPLDLPRAHLYKKFKQIITAHHEGERGKRHTAKSEALYPTGGKIDTKFLQVALQVWDMRQSEPKKPLWEIANDLKIGSKENWLSAAELKMKGHLPVADKKNVLAATASRYIKKAQRMIDDTAKGKFPNP